MPINKQIKVYVSSKIEIKQKIKNRKPKIENQKYKTKKQ